MTGYDHMAIAEHLQRVFPDEEMFTMPTDSLSDTDRVLAELAKKTTADTDLMQQAADRIAELERRIERAHELVADAMSHIPVGHNAYPDLCQARTILEGEGQ